MHATTQDNTAIVQMANALRDQIKAATSRFAEYNAVKLICGSGIGTGEDDVKLLMARIAPAMRQSLADMVETRDRCQREAWTAWREACDAAHPLFVKLMNSCGVAIAPVEGAILAVQFKC